MQLRDGGIDGGGNKKAYAIAAVTGMPIFTAESTTLKTQRLVAEPAKTIISTLHALVFVKLSQQH